MLTFVLQFHPREQDLNCPGCQASFKRAGALMEHLERKGCPRISASALHQQRAEKIEFVEKLQSLSLQSPDPNGYEAKADNFYSANRVFFTSEDFPKVSSQAYRDGDSKTPDLLTGSDYVPVDELNMGSWGKQEVLFPNATPAHAPTAAQLQALQQPDKKAEHDRDSQFNPRHPRFNAKSNYNPITERYNCPWTKCM